MHVNPVDDSCCLVSAVAVSAPYKLCSHEMMDALVHASNNMRDSSRQLVVYAVIALVWCEKMYCRRQCRNDELHKLFSVTSVYSL